MVRAPCCEKMGLKKGPWSPEEDQILINHIRLHGHANWRALPKQAGLLRCGKSCRLRWTNYLRPDIKRGNFTKEEEETIINLHHKLGNRWSAIAAQLPGRTDNEIKNVWHTHLKKRVKPPASGNAPLTSAGSSPDFERHKNDVVSSHSSCCSSIKIEAAVEMDEDFWSEVLSEENSGGATGWDDVALWSEIVTGEEGNLSSFTTGDGDDVDFWLDMLCQADLSLQLEDV